MGERKKKMFMKVEWSNEGRQSRMGKAGIRSGDGKTVVGWKVVRRTIYYSGKKC